MKGSRGLIVLIAFACCAASPQAPQPTGPPAHKEGLIAADLIWHADPLKWYERWMTSRGDMTCPEEGLCFRKTSTLVCTPLNGVPSCTNVYEACSLLWIEEQDATHAVVSFFATDQIRLRIDTDVRRLTFFTSDGQDVVSRMAKIEPNCLVLRDRCKTGRCMTVGTVISAP